MEKFINTCGKDFDVVLLCCRRCLLNVDEIHEVMQHERGLVIKPFILPCSSRVHPSHLLKILERGTQAIALVACLETACQLVTGSRRVERRVHYVQDLLSSINENPERVGLTRCKSISSQELVALAKKRLANSRDIYTIEGEEVETL